VPDALALPVNAITELQRVYERVTEVETTEPIHIETKDDRDPVGVVEEEAVRVVLTDSEVMTVLY
jgi:hypothetical protein